MLTFPLAKRRGTLAKAAILASALTLAVPLVATTAEARAGGGSSFGSRGSRTFSAPSFTNTAPRPAAPIQRSETPSFGAGAQNLGAAAQPRRFGFGSGLAAGLLGAGLFGLLSGSGFFGGLGGIGSLFGLLIQLALIAGVVMLALRFFANRNARAATAGGPGAGQSGFMGRTAQDNLGGGTQPAGGAPVTIGPQDYAAFEERLVDVQDAYGREDMNALARLSTPEMMRFLESDIAENRRQGVRNDVGEARLLQGDLSEAWREGWAEYATVAMRFAARDVMVDRASGRVVSGDPRTPVEATELWTFRRDRGGLWLVSAIQQTR